MSGTLKISQIFTPNDTPTVTYVERGDLKLEAQLKAFYETPKMVVSISGPSKSGKTVLVKKVIPEEYIIPVVGSGIESANSLWGRVLQWMDVPSSETVSHGSAKSISGSVAGNGKISLPVIGEVGADADFGGSSTWEKSTTQTFDETGITRVIREISNSDFVVFIDDFHYIHPSLREEVGRQIKVVAESGVKILTASVPHRSDDVVRSNPELRGRVAAVDLGRWSTQHLALIARQGFDSLNAELAPAFESRLAEEALGSPQLMQSICFNLCHILGIYGPLEDHKRIEISDRQLTESLLQTSQFTDFSKLLTSLHAGPRTRGTERKIHDLVDKSKGDVYRAVLLAMKQEPITLSYSYDEIIRRVRNVCIGDSPAGSSVTSCLEQMKSISDSLMPSFEVIAWDGDRLDIIDPYFTFFLRCSEKLSNLA